ncbi:MAG: VCBS repeat-containing protein, partial [Candidatus Parcubacteria bacterium]|nr:VCBS repeat-containing protein [Candidatus Parcubacteria bacterium]
MIKLRKIRQIPSLLRFFNTKAKLFWGVVFLFIAVLGFIYYFLHTSNAIPFWQPTFYATGSYPNFVITDDFNNDSINDLVVTNRDEATFSFFSGNADGTFDAQAKWGTGSKPTEMISGFIDNDANKDIALINQLGGTFSVFSGDGTGGFMAATYDVGVGAGNTPMGIAAADFNNDHKLDLAITLVTGAPATYKVKIFLNDGTGLFALNSTYSLGTIPAGVTASDFNNDSKIDLVVANYGLNTISVFLGNGDGTFNPAVNYTVGMSPYSVKTFDINNDTITDLITNNYGSGSLSILLGVGDGTFTAATDISVIAAGVKPRHLTVADFNADTKLDLAISDVFNSLVAIYFNDGAGSFTLAGKYSSGNGATCSAAADFNDDGKMDLAVVNTTEGVTRGLTIMFGIGQGNLGALGHYPVGTNPQSIISVDVNNDNLLDLVTANKGNASVILGNVNGVPTTTASYPIKPTWSYSVAAADFNSDVYQDLVFGYISGTQISVLFNNGNGTFAAATNFNVVSSPRAVVTGDFNNDNKQDIAAANYDSSFGVSKVSVLLNNGSGSFNAAVNYDVSASPQYIIAKDLNNDNNLDLVTAHVSNTNNVSVLFGNGDGTFAAAVAYTITPYAPYSVASADFNGDGFSDLAVSAQNGDLTDGRAGIMLNNGDGSFQAPVYYNVKFKPYTVVAGDLNNDGIQDLAVANYQNYDPPMPDPRSQIWVLSVLLGNGNGTFQPQKLYEVRNGPRGLTSGDFNGDNRLDLASANYDNNSVSILLDLNFYLDSIFPESALAGTPGFPLTIIGSGFDSSSVARFNGSNRPTTYVSATELSMQIYASDLANPGTFNVDIYQPILNLTTDVQPFSVIGSFLPVNNINVQAAPEAVAGANLNSDNIQDLVVVNSGSNSVSVLHGQGSGVFDPAINYAVGTAPLAVNIIDLNNDSKKDLAVVNSGSNNISILLGTGTGTFGAAVDYAVGTNPYAIFGSDYNKDGNNDLVVANYGSNNISVLLGNGDGTLAAPVDYGAGTGPYSVFSLDLNNDTNLDLAVANSGSNNVSILLGSGAGTFSAAVNYNVGSNPHTVWLEDINGNANPDLITANFGSNNISVLSGNGDGTFAAANNFTAGTGPYALAIADINNDDNKDVAVTNASSNKVSLLLGDGSGNFGSAVGYTVGTTPHGIFIADIDNDLNSDIISANFGSDNISILTNKGSIGTGLDVFMPAVNYLVGTYPRSIVNADFNGDNKIDLAVANYTAPYTSILLGTGNGTFVAGTNINFADFNSDNNKDLAVANGNSDSLSVLLGNGDGTFGSKTDYTVGRAPNTVVTTDFNGDAILDLAVSNSFAGTISVLFGNGSGGFGGKVDYVICGTLLGPYYLHVADLNNDNKADLIAVHDNRYISGSESISISLGKGDGTFYPAVFYPLEANTNEVSSGDFNEDGNLDLVVTSEFSHNWVEVWFGNGNGTFSGKTTYAAGSRPYGITSADFNGDTKTDLAVTNLDTSNVSIFLRKVTKASSYRAMPSSPANFKCEVLTASKIRWKFEDAANNETGFALYDNAGKISDMAGEIVTGSGYFDEINLLPNTKYENRYAVSYNSNGVSAPSNTDSCYTLANDPLPAIITVTDGRLQIAIDNGDGNPPGTDYAIYEYYSDSYLHSDGKLYIDEPQWRPYEGWGGRQGLNIVDNPASYQFYILARNSAGLVSGFMPQGLLLSCKAISSHEINWQLKAPSNWEKTGYNFYRVQTDESPLLIREITDSGTAIIYAEKDLTPNSSYSGFFTTYKTIEDNKTESEASNTDKCFTLANKPLPIIIGAVTEDSVQLILDNKDGNPPETLYAIYDAKSGMYVQADGSLGSEPFWQTYEQWGGANGIYVKVLGAQVSGQFRISLAGV